MNQNHTPETIAAALRHIPANCPRDEWAKVLAAIKSEFPDETGFELANTWSATAGDQYDPRAMREAWRSLKSGGGVGIGTLFYLAKQNGFTMPKGERTTTAPDPGAVARLASERSARQAAEQVRQQAAHAQASTRAAQQWGEASDTGQSAYLVRKGVAAYGLRFAADGTLLVPMRDAAGTLHNLQRIAPTPPTNGGTDKLVLKGGRKSGLWHWCGNPQGASVLLLAEGYATAASLHQATGYPTACAFDAGNLPRVAKTLHQAHPAALLVICGDDDRATQARTGNNPGQQKATAAAQAVQGLAVFPQNLPEGKSDFNDLHQTAGPEAVKECIDLALDSPSYAADDLQAIAHLSNWAEPNEIKSDLPLAPAFDATALLPATLMHFVLDEADRMPCSPDYIASALIVCLGSVIGARCSIKPKRRDERRELKAGGYFSQAPWGEALGEEAADSKEVEEALSKVEVLGEGGAPPPPLPLPTPPPPPPPPPALPASSTLVK
jgi:phage/plasmid primase-like uncharacterized protein